MTDEHGWIDNVRIYSSLEEKGKGLSFLYFLGVKQTIESDSVSAALELMTKERRKNETPLQLKQFASKAESHNKLDLIGKI